MRLTPENLERILQECGEFLDCYDERALRQHIDTVEAELHFAESELAVLKTVRPVFNGPIVGYVITGHEIGGSG